jgi:signal transduction histidine kinase
LADVIRTGRAVTLSSLTERELAYPDGAADHRAMGLSAVAAVPLKFGDGVIGAFSYCFGGEREFSVADMALLDAIAGQTAQALERARLYEQAERQRAELRDADRQKNQFLAVLSHELRNPLTPIKNSLFILDHAAPGGAQASRAKAIITRQTTHLARLVDDLLDVSRIISGKLRLQRARFDLAQVLRRTAEDHRAVLGDCGITLDVRVNREPCWMDGDETRMAQALGNLLGNSAKFTERGGTVVLDLDGASTTGSAIICVRDTGVGIAPDLLRRLFEPFVQADSTLDRSKSGLGLGLALVKSVVELHGGTVEAPWVTHPVSRPSHGRM